MVLQNREYLLSERLVCSVLADLVTDCAGLELIELVGGPEHQSIESGGKDVEVWFPGGFLSLAQLVYHDENEREPWVKVFEYGWKEFGKRRVLDGQDTRAGNAKEDFIF